MGKSLTDSATLQGYFITVFYMYRNDMLVDIIS